MHQLDVPRFHPPSWTDELRTAILWPNRRCSSQETLDPVSAGSEFEAWLHDARPYDGRHKPGWLSAIADFCHSTNQIGPKLRGTLAGDLTQCIATANSIKGDLENHSPSTLGTLLPSRLPADRIVYGRLKARWAEPGTREAAWQDLVDACRDPAISSDTLAVRLDLFWQLIRAADYSTDQMSRLLSGILGNIEPYITEARLWLGDITESQPAWPRPDRDAGLTEAQQLTLCQRILTKAPAPAHHVVWLAFDRAGPGGANLEVGSVSLWNCEWVRSVLELGGPNLEQIPSELRASDGLFTYTNLPEARDVILARVDLGTAAFTDPVRVAAEQAEAVIALAGFHVGEARWRRISGYVDVVDGHIRSIGTFSSPHDIADMPNGLYQDAMEAQLEKLVPRLASHLPIIDSSLTEVVQAVRWWEAARRQTPLAALLLHVRVLELIASRVQAGPWQEYIESNLQTTWIRQTIINELAQIVSDCIFSYERIASDVDRQWLRELSIAMSTWRKGGRTLDLGKGLEVLPRLVSVFPRHDPLGRRAQTIGRRLETPAALMSWCSELGEEWQRITKRLQRMRNALAHGGPLQDNTAETVHGFAQKLAAWSLSLALEGILDGKSVAAAHDERRREDDMWWGSLSSASSVADALFTA